MTTVSAVLGNSQRLDGGAMFGNAPRPLWERWIAPDERNRIPLACRAMLVEEPSRRVLVEAGIGAFFAPAMRDRFGVVESHHVLLESLAALGVAPDDVDVIVLTHLHFDHAGGLLTAYAEGQAPQLVFPRARYVVGADAWERANHPHARDRASFIPELPGLLEATGRLEIVKGDRSETLGDGWRLHLSEGHTPGLLLPEVASDDGPIVFAGDLIPGRPWMHLPITMGYDRFPEKLIEEKSVLLEDLHARGGRLFFTHDPSVAMARVSKDDKGRFGPGQEWDAPVRLSV
ncbi:MAG: MBL fold metallo-hydrolase [Sandaracinus sp.]|nr:MBL fold metallo-hydrolase [Sandaracinus sp.]MCB9619569.1 MBL fold metallo-hydrolase [Sandaracinus sp.]MCB9637076.1 MBL fold metallo-hydrolase [Sandaracinus sp.]